MTNGFEDFSILTNVPYGVQSKEKQRQTDTDLHNLYRRIGRFLRTYSHLEHNSYILAQAHHFGHKLSFEKFSNCGWDKVLVFSNGGIGVHLLKMDMSQVSEVKQTLEAYKELDGGNTATSKRQVEGEANTKQIWQTELRNKKITDDSQKPKGDEIVEAE